MWNFEELRTFLSPLNKIHSMTKLISIYENCLQTKKIEKTKQCICNKNIYSSILAKYLWVKWELYAIELGQKQPSEVFRKKGCSKLAIFTGKHRCWSLCLIKLETLRPTALLKRDSKAGVSCKYWRNFKNNLFGKTFANDCVC